jgi:preprotein translocase subunit SecD
VAVALAGALALACARAPEDSVLATARDVELVCAIDADQVRAAGWTAGDAGDEEARAAALALVRRRLGATEEARSAAVERMEEGLAVRLAGADAGATADLVASALRDLGRFELALVAAADGADADVDVAAERARLAAWIERHPGAPIASFELVPRDAGGPHARIAWRPFEVAPEVDAIRPAADSAVALLLPASLRELFGAGAVAKAHASSDALGYPAVGFELVPERQSDFRAFTRRNVGRQLAVLVRGIVVSSPTILSELPGAGIVQGRFDSEEARRLAAELDDVEGMPGPLRVLEIRAK